jgi:hypothetical protein
MREAVREVRREEQREEALQAERDDDNEHPLPELIVEVVGGDGDQDGDD